MPLCGMTERAIAQRLRGRQTAKRPPPEAIGGGRFACVQLVKGKKKKEKNPHTAPMRLSVRAAQGALYSPRTEGMRGEESKKAPTDLCPSAPLLSTREV